MKHFKKIKFFLDKLLNTQARLDKIARLSIQYFGDEILTDNLTYKQFYAAAYEISLAIKIKYKTKPDIPIVIDLESSLTYMKIFWAIIMSGCRPILMNYAFDHKMKKQLIKSVHSKIIINQLVANQLLKLVKQVNKDINFDSNWNNLFGYFTSGTTNLPKLVIHSGAIVKRQILCSKYVLKASSNITLQRNVENIRILMLLPLYHIFGLLVNMFWFGSLGIRFVFPDSLSFDEIKSKCITNKVTHIFAPPLLWNAIAKQIVDKARLIGQYDTLMNGIKLANRLRQWVPFFGDMIANSKFKALRAQLLGDLKFIINGGGFIDKETMNILNGIGYKVHNGYGLSEVGIVSVDLKNRNNNDPTYVGRAFPLMKASVDTDMNLFVDAFIYENGDFISRHYLTNDIATLRNKDLHIIGRKDDIIIGQNGENISPNTVEVYFKSLNVPVAAVGIKQHTLSDRLVLFVESNRDLSMAISKIIKKIPPMHLPKEFFLIKRIPINALNKIKYFELSDLYIEHYASLRPINFKSIRHEQKIDKKTALIASKICNYYKLIFPTSVKTINIYSDIFNDLGGSSLDYFNLVEKISTDFQIDVHFQDISNFRTPLDFAKFIKTKNNRSKSRT